MNQKLYLFEAVNASGVCYSVSEDKKGAGVKLLHPRAKLLGECKQITYIIYSATMPRLNVIRFTKLDSRIGYVLLNDTKANPSIYTIHNIYTSESFTVVKPHAEVVDCGTLDTGETRFKSFGIFIPSSNDNVKNRVELRLKIKKQLISFIDTHIEFLLGIKNATEADIQRSEESNEDEYTKQT